MPPHWYALRSKPNKEEALWRELTARGDHAYYPRLRVHPVNPRARKVKPYFPGYIFLQADRAAAGASSFAWMPYSLGLVSFDGEPALVPTELLAAIRLRVAEINAAGGEQVNTHARHARGLKAGDKVAINEGPFAGYQAIFDAHVDGADRVRVLLQFMQSRPMKLELSAAYVHPTNRR